MTRTLPHKRVKVDDEFNLGSKPLPENLSSEATDFWQWWASDLCENTTRGGLAEFLVALALGVSHKERREWENFDVKAPDGTKVEVKATGYVQTDHSSAKQNSTPRWEDIGPKKDSHGDKSGKSRWSDVYVFSLHTETEPDMYDALDLSKWQFWVIATSILNSEISDQQSIGLNPLKSLGAEKVGLLDLEAAILRAARSE